MLNKIEMEINGYKYKFTEDPNNNRYIVESSTGYIFSLNGRDYEVYKGMVNEYINSKSTVNRHK